MERVHLVIIGEVQAVGFRFTAIEVARDLGLTGWVKNNPDGSVEIVAEGPKEKLENLLTWAKTGPPLARIEDVKIEWQQATGEFGDFTAKY
ncbi:MAG: acylphosphatase [Candidatus Woykebacteria bacterium GWB1_45_5]|uniref:acylphosphatase n=2 Tax=Candidatus Woykeibacteriota TaxID=1817899 RepID=A0A1G1W4I1_9BACT|nr:MAG: acylphosphatase [Candidatus Woykebacteria bacterium GWA1_44_8]OGY24544.1 MAG: acylphosphatase [Candidatus Woykebacteria bacterium GWB1_45_5]